MEEICCICGRKWLQIEIRCHGHEEKQKRTFYGGRHIKFLCVFFGGVSGECEMLIMKIICVMISGLAWWGTTSDTTCFLLRDRLSCCMPERDAAGWLTNDRRAIWCYLAMSATQCRVPLTTLRDISSSHGRCVPKNIHTQNFSKCVFWAAKLFCGRIAYLIKKCVWNTQNAYRLVGLRH